MLSQEVTFCHCSTLPTEAAVHWKLWQQNPEMWGLEQYRVAIPLLEVCTLSSPHIFLCCLGEEEGVLLVPLLLCTLPALVRELFLSASWREEGVEALDKGC